MDEIVSDKIKQDLINTGIFLESDTYQLFKNWKEGRIFTYHREYPYSYGRGSLNLDGTIDVLAETSIQDTNKVILLPIECKKADPKIKHWVFEPHRPEETFEQEFLLSVKEGKNYFTRWYNFSGLGYNSFSDYENCVNVFEFSETNGSLSRNKEKDLRAFYAIRQANESIPGLINNVELISRNTAYDNVIIPIVVTTANLWITDYNPADITKEGGEIPKDKLNLKAKDWVMYSYPLSFHESIDGEEVQGKNVVGPVTPNKRLTFIVKSTALEAFVKHLIGDLR